MSNRINPRRRPFAPRAGGPPPKELYALGKQEENTPAPPTTLAQREDGPPAKKRIHGAPTGMIPLGGGAGLTNASSSVADLFSVPARQATSGPSQTLSNMSVIEVPPQELADKIQEAIANQNVARVEGILCGALKLLKEGRGKIPNGVPLCLMSVAKNHPKMFTTPPLIQALADVLRRDSSAVRGIKTNPSAAVTTCAILMHVLEEDRNWPDALVYAFVEDSLHERVWVDRDCCRKFVENLVTAFGTTLPSIQQLNECAGGAAPPRPQAAAPHSVPDLAEASAETVGSRPGTPFVDASSIDFPSVKVTSRYHVPSLMASFRQLAMSHVVEVTQRRPNQPFDVSRNTLRFLASVAGLPAARAAVVPRLEQWMQISKLTRYAQELLLSVCLNTGAAGHEDKDVIHKLVQIRLKPKQLAEKYMYAVKELLRPCYPDNPSNLLNYVILNELQPQRNPNNMQMLIAIFQHDGVNAPKALAFTFQSLLLRDDYLRALRSLLREIVRQVRSDIDLGSFAIGLLQPRSDISSHGDTQIRERIANSIADLVCIAGLLAAQPCLRDNTPAVVSKFQQTISTIVQHSLSWVLKVGPRITRSSRDAALCKTWIRKFLFIESPEAYTQENWPPENERNGLINVITNAPVHEEQLVTLLTIGMSEVHFSPADALEYMDQVVMRSAAAHTSAHPTLSSMDSYKSLFQAVLNSSVYRAPPNIILPEGYVAPRLAINSTYWKGWSVLFLLAAFNPKSIGVYAWKHYPILRCLMEMAMTNTFTYPPSVGASETKETVLAKEQQQRLAEREEILAYENHLSQACKGQPVSEATSLLLNSVAHRDEHGPARRPPKEILDRLQSSCRRLKLGNRLCRSRDPDFLLDIINIQGAAQSLSWLSELVASGDGSGSVDLLPTPSLCEFLMAHCEAKLDSGAWAPIETKDHMKFVLKVKRGEVEGRVKALLCGEESNVRGMLEVLEYFFKKLSSDDARSRHLGMKCLSSVLNNVPMFAASTPMDVVTTPLPREDEDFDVQLLLEESLARRKSSTPGGAQPSVLSTLSTSNFNTPTALREEFAWLLVNLPRLRSFHTSLLPMIIPALRTTCLSESDPALLRAIICFLAEHTKDSDLPLVALDLGSFVVTRPKMFEIVLREASTGTSNDAGNVCNGVLLALVTLFSRSLQLAQRSKERPNAWDPKAMLQMKFPNDESVPGHVFIIHALLSLLCETPSSSNGLHSSLLELFFPKSGGVVTAFILDTETEAEVFTEAMRLRMIRSSNQQVVDAAIQCATTMQLLEDLQFFGIPVANVSKILEALDSRLLEDPSPLYNPALSKSHILLVLNVHFGRGSVGGLRLASMLGAAEPRPVSCKRETLGLSQLTIKKEAEEMKVESPMDSQAHTAHGSMPRTIEGWQTLLEKAFHEGDLMLARSAMDVVTKVLQRSLSALHSGAMSCKQEIVPDESVEDADQVCSALLRLLPAGKEENFAEALSQRPIMSCRILQLLSARQALLCRLNKPSSFFVRLLLTLSKAAHHMKSGPFTTSLSEAVKRYSKSPKPPASLTTEVTSSLSALVPKHFTRVKREPDVHPPSFFSLSEPSLCAFAVERAVRALKAAKESGELVGDVLLRKALKEIARYQPMYLEQFVDVLFSPSSTTGKLLKISFVKLECDSPSVSGPCRTAPQTASLVQFACSLLSENRVATTNDVKNGDAELSVPVKAGQHGTPHLASLLIDTLQLLDPELTQVSPEVQRLLLFSHRHSSNGAGRTAAECNVDNADVSICKQDDTEEGHTPMVIEEAISRGESSVEETTSLPSSNRQSVLVPYLAHHSSWHAIKSKLEWMLSRDHTSSASTDAKTTLDFIGTCLNLPRLQQGLAKKDSVVGSESKGLGNDRLYLHLPANQVNALIGLVLKECRDEAPAVPTNDLPGDDLACCPRYAAIVQSRVSTILAAGGAEESHLAAVVNSLCSDGSSGAWSLLVHLYLARPRILDHIDVQLRSRLLSLAMLCQDTDCSWDAAIQSLIMNMSQLSSEESAKSELGADSYLKCRFLASMHPALFLRHIGVLSAVLCGRAHLSFKVFQSRQHHVVFTYALSLLDSAQPYVFHKSVHDHLLVIITTFTEMLQHYCTVGKAFASLSERIAQFVLSYVKEANSEAMAFLKSKLAMWRTVAKVQVKSASLHRLCDYLSASTENAATSSSDGADELTPEEALRQKVLLEDTEMEQEETMGASAGTAGETRPAGEAINAVESTFTLEKLTPFLQDLEPSQTSSSIHSALQDLDNASMKCPSILEHFLLHLQQLMVSGSNECKLLAMKLLVRYIRKNPQDTDRFVPAFLCGLQSSDLVVVTAIIQSMPELVIFSRKFSHRLLTESFSASMTNFLDSTHSHILRGIKLSSIR